MKNIYLVAIDTFKVNNICHTLVFLYRINYNCHNNFDAKLQFLI